MVYICMQTRKTPHPPHKEREREMERKGEGPTRFVCWMRATESKIVRERERAGVWERGRSRFMHQRLI